jgi:hypothetical protein
VGRRVLVVDDDALGLEVTLFARGTSASSHQARVSDAAVRDVADLIRRPDADLAMVIDRLRHALAAGAGIGIAYCGEQASGGPIVKSATSRKM